MCSQFINRRGRRYFAEHFSRYSLLDGTESYQVAKAKGGRQIPGFITNSGYKGNRELKLVNAFQVSP
jgi:hypothetical protein